MNKLLLILLFVLSMIAIARCSGTPEPVKQPAAYPVSSDIGGSIGDARKNLARIRESAAAVQKASLDVRAAAKATESDAAWAAIFDVEREAISLRAFASDIESSLAEVEQEAKRIHGLEAENARMAALVASKEAEIQAESARRMAGFAVAFGVVGLLVFVGGLAVAFFLQSPVKGGALCAIGSIMVVAAYAAQQHARDFGTIGLWVVAGSVAIGVVWFIREMATAKRGLVAAERMTGLIERLKQYLTPEEADAVFKGEPLYDPATYRFVEAARNRVAAQATPTETKP